MKTYIISQFYPPDFAATGQLLHELVEELSKKGIKIDVFTGVPSYAFNYKKNNKFENLKSVKIFRTGKLNLKQNNFLGRSLNGLFFSIKGLFFLLRKLNKKDFIIFTTEPAFLPVFAYFLNIFKKSNYLILLFDLYPDIVTKFEIIKEHNLVIKIWRYLLRKSYKNASKIVVLSESMKDELEKHFPEFREKIEIISAWADQNKIIPIKREKNWFAIKHNLLNNFVVLYSGNQGRCHDLETIIKAANLLKKALHIKFIFIGEGVQKKFIQNLVENLNLQNCLFLPYQDYDNIPYSLNIADVAIVSLNQKASNLVAPSKLYGHLAASTPIGAICPESSYLYRIIKSNKFGKAFINGDYKNLANWIKALSSKESLKKNYQLHSRNFLLKHCNKKDIVDKYYSIIINEI